jgi:peptidoglycan/LPS O-acetylase OafA/YrhL
VRAIAISLVLVSHLINHDIFPIAAEIGHMGVLLFFALSGYLITTRLLQEYHSTGRISLRDFYLRRAFRILPPAVTYLAILAFLSAIGWVACDYRSILAALFFYVNYIPVATVAWKAGHFWSLSVEEHFYLVWPLLLILSGVIAGWRTALGLAIGICLWRAAIQDAHWSFHTDYIADTLLWGCCLAFVQPRKIPLWVTAGLCASFLFFEFGPLNNGGRAEVLLRHLLPSALLGAIVMSPLRFRFLDLAPVQYVGRLSYSLYIWQQLFLGGQGSTLPKPLAVTAIFACAYLSYRFIEQPFIALGRQVIRRSAIPARPLPAHQPASPD